MNQAELIIKSELEKEGFEVIKKNSFGLPDFNCKFQDKEFYVEVKSKADGLKIDQILRISQLIETGYNVFLFFIDDNNKIEKFNISLNIQKVKFIDKNKINSTNKIKEIKDIIEIDHSKNLKGYEYVINVKEFYQKQILNFINTLEKPMSIRQIGKNVGVSSATTLKHVDILHSQKKINVEHYGIMKLVSPIKEK